MVPCGRGRGPSLGHAADESPEALGRKAVVTPARERGEAALPTRADPALLRALARAFRYQRLLNEGRYASISEMAEAEKIERGYLGTLLRLTLLAPAIVEALLDGRHAAELGSPKLMRPFPVDDWPGQRAVFAGAARKEPPPGALNRG